MVHKVVSDETLLTVTRTRWVATKGSTIGKLVGNKGGRGEENERTTVILGWYGLEDARKRRWYAGKRMWKRKGVTAWNLLIVKPRRMIDDMKTAEKAGKLGGIPRKVKRLAGVWEKLSAGGSSWKGRLIF